MAKCNYDCLHCRFDDCLNDSNPTSLERMEAAQRDRNYTDYGKIILKSRAQRAKHKVVRH